MCAVVSVWCNSLKNLVWGQSHLDFIQFFFKILQFSGPNIKQDLIGWELQVYLQGMEAIFKIEIVPEDLKRGSQNHAQRSSWYVLLKVDYRLVFVLKVSSSLGRKKVER